VRNTRITGEDAFMNTDRLNSWLSLGANLGVLAGIILVAYEINQANLTTRAEMISNHQDRWVTIDLSWQEGEIADAWAKAMENPGELTVAEMVRLNGLMWSYIDHIGTNRMLWELGIFDETIPTSEAIISANAYIFFGNEFSRAWLEENRKNLNSETMVIVDKVLAELSANETLESYQRIKSTIVGK
jgi:hypothetical protein